MNHIFHFILAFIVIIILSTLVSHDYKNIRIRFIIQLLIIEILFAYFLLNSKSGLYYVQTFSFIFDQLLHFATEGIEFVFGNMNKYGLAFFFLNVLCPIVFISVIIGVLQYFYILSLVINIIGTVLSKINGIGKFESFNAISSLILGQSGNFITYRNVIQKLSERRMYSMVITAMSTTSISIIGSYIRIIEPKYVLVALVLNIFSTFIILLLVNPGNIDEQEDLLICNLNSNNKNFFEMLEEHILLGFKMAIIIAAMLMGFISLISAVNATFSFLFGIEFQNIIGYILSPLAWIIGIPICEALQAGTIMATKLISNEFVAMIALQKISFELSDRSISMLSVFLVSFANFSSIGIIAGTLKGINDQQGKVVLRNGMKLLYSATLVSILSASIVGLVI